MSSLIVLCPHCLTWIEPHAQCCTECAGGVNVDDPDPISPSIADRVGEQLVDLGAFKLVRRGWPNSGRLVVTSQGLLFVPSFTVSPNGALEAIADDPPDKSNRVAGLFHWWSLPPWRRPVDQPVDQVPSAVSPQSAVELLLDSPGAFFVQRTTIQRINVRWGRAQIERRPSRSVTFSQTPSGPNPRDALRSLSDFPTWRTIVAGL